MLYIGTLAVTLFLVAASVLFVATGNHTKHPK